MTALTVQNQSFSIDELKEIARASHASGLYGFTKPEQHFMLMLKAQARGQHPALVVDDYHFFEGKAAPKAETILAWHLASGGGVEWIQSSATVCEADFWYKEGTKFRVKWTIEDAKRAGLTEKNNWKKYPEDMLAARCIGRGVKRVNPGALKGEKILEEIQDAPKIEGDDAPEAEAASPAPQPPKPSVPRASEAAKAEAGAHEASFSPVASAAPEPAEAPPASEAAPAAPEPAQAAPEPAGRVPHPTSSTFLKENMKEVRSLTEPTSGKLRYGIFTTSMGVVGTFSKKAADAVLASIARNQPIELAYISIPVEGKKDRQDLVWFDGEMVTE